MWKKVLINQFCSQFSAERNRIAATFIDYALADYPDCINIFIHSDMENRVKAVSKRLNITENKAKDLIQKKDKQRASYYNYYSSKRWGDSTSYHLTLDAGKLGIDGCVDMILKFREIMDAQK